MIKGTKTALWISLSLVVALVIAFAVYVFCILYVASPSEHTQAENIQVGLELGRLSDLPSSATEIQAEGVDGLFSETVYIKFKASQQDIDRFITASQGLQGVEPVAFDSENWKSSNESLLKKYPWFYPNTTDGLAYVIPQNENADYGTVMVDRTAGVVYIQTSHS